MKKTVIVTGGTRGIGAGVSEVLAVAGWHVIAASNSQQEIDAFAPATSVDVAFLDVTDDQSVSALFSQYT